MTKAGIYRITNKINNKLYIGQSVDLATRKRNHINSLSKFKHRNKYLQNSVNKYNIDNFTFEIIETIDPFDKNSEECMELLNYLEMFYIESYESLVHQKGYNIRNGGNNCSGYYLLNTIRYVFYNPENEEILVDNLAKFCKENHLELSTMRRVFYEEVESHKQWTKYKKSFESRYTIKSPNGLIYEFNNLQEFALAHDLSPQLLSKVVTGNRPHHRFWSLPKTELDYEKITYKSCPINKNIKYDWVNTITEETIYCTTLELAKKYKLQSQALYKVTDPNTCIKSHHNWTIKNIENIKIKPKSTKPSYKFKHEKLGLFEGTQQELIQKYPELLYSKINAVVNNTRPHHKGWRIDEIDFKRDLVVLS